MFVGIVTCAQCTEPVPPLPSPSPIDNGQLPTVPPDAGVTPSGAVTTFAINEVFLGESDRDGTSLSNSDWKLYGYDLDGRTTNAQSTDVCTLAPGASITNQDDGISGTDNAAGSVLVPIIETVLSSDYPSGMVSNFIVAGGWTLEIQVVGLTDDPNQTAVGLAAQVFVGATRFQSKPAFDHTDNWPVRPSSLADGMTIAGGATVQFTNVFVTNGVVVAEGASQPLTIPFGIEQNFEDLFLPIHVHDVVLTFHHTTPSTATYGTIAGVLDAQEFATAFHTTLDISSTSLCGRAFDGLAQQIQQAQDILVDGTNASGVPCNAISIGLGFNAKVVENPTLVGVDPIPLSDPCDAGVDAPATD